MNDILPRCWAPIFRDPYTFYGLRWGSSLNLVRKNLLRDGFRIPDGLGHGFPAPGAASERMLMFSGDLDNYLVKGIGTFTADRLTNVGIEITRDADAAKDPEVMYAALRWNLEALRGAPALEGETDRAGVLGAEWPSDPRGALTVAFRPDNRDIHLLYAGAPAVAREVAWYD